MTRIGSLLVLLAVVYLPSLEALQVTTEPHHDGMVEGSVTLECTYTRPEEHADSYIITWSFITEGSAKYTVYIDNSGSGEAFGHLVGRSAIVGDYASLKIDRLDLKDIGNYECRVDFYVIQEVGSATTHLEVHKKVDEVDIIDHAVGEFVFVKLGEEVTFTCISKYGRPAAKLGWYRDVELTDPVDFEVIDNLDGTFHTSSELTFTPTKEDDGVVVKCQSNQDPDLQGLHLSDNVVISISGAGITGLSTVLLMISVLFSTL